MPKLKTHKASRRRMKVSATGKVLVHPTGGRHMMSGKPAKKRRHIRRARPLGGMDRVRTLKAFNMSAKPKPVRGAKPVAKTEGA